MLNEITAINNKNKQNKRINEIKITIQNTHRNSSSAEEIEKGGFSFSLTGKFI